MKSLTFVSPSIFLAVLGFWMDNVPTEPNVPYGPDPAQVADYYYPRNTSRITHTIILIHGGGFGFRWLAGRKELLIGLIPFLQEAFPRTLIVNMTFRLGTISSPAIPKQLQDIRDLVNFIKWKENNPKMSFALFGVSSGAHLALLYAYKWDAERKDVAAVIDLLGPSDLSASAYAGNPFYTGLLMALMGPVLSSERFMEVSPLNWVTPETTKTLGFYGDRDVLVPASQGRRLKARLDLMGVENEFTFFDGSHFTLTRGIRWDMAQKIKGFLNKHF